MHHLCLHRPNCSNVQNHRIWNSFDFNRSLLVENEHIQCIKNRETKLPGRLIASYNHILMIRVLSQEGGICNSFLLQIRRGSLCPSWDDEEDMIFPVNQLPTQLTIRVYDRLPAAGCPLFIVKFDWIQASRTTSTLPAHESILCVLG